MNLISAIFQDANKIDYVTKYQIMLALIQMQTIVRNYCPLMIHDNKYKHDNGNLRKILID